MTKSALKLAQLSLKVAQASLPAYAHKFLPKHYMQHQLFSIWVLRQFFKTEKSKPFQQSKIASNLFIDRPTNRVFSQVQVIQQLRSPAHLPPQPHVMLAGKLTQALAHPMLAT